MKTASPRLWLLLALLGLGYFGLLAFHPGLYFALGVNHYDAWFLDTFALLASNDAVARGLDPYAPNPLDYFHRPHVYSHWWLGLRHLGLTRAHSLALGAALGGGFLVAAWARLRPRSLGQLAGYAAVLGAMPVVLALDRANNDLLIFVLLALLVPCLRSERRELRLLAVGLVAVAAGLKYYPAAAGLVLLAGAGRAERRSRLVIALLLLALVALSIGPDLVRHGRLAPQPEGLMTFGATAAFSALGWTGWLPKLLALLAALLAAGLGWRRRVLADWAPSPAQQSDWLHLVLGAVLLTGCFFTSLNHGYRWIFALWLAPLLWGLPGDAASPPAVRRLARWTRGLLLFVLWWAPACCLVLNGLIGVVPGAMVTRLAQAVFLIEQPADWALFGCLLVFLTHFARTQLQQLRGDDASLPERAR